VIYDVIIAGAGVTGAFIARELSRYELDVCILEKGNDVASGASKANSGIIHAGFDSIPGTLKSLLSLRGNRIIAQIARELDVPFKKTGSLVTGFGDEDLQKLKGLLKRGIANGVEGLEIIDKKRIKMMEPHISDDVTHALYAPDSGIICPYELTVAAVENAVKNGVELYRSTEVQGIYFRNDLIYVETVSETFACRYFVNAAGVNAGKVAEMAGDDSITIVPRKGEYLLMDKTAGGIVNMVIFQCPTEKGKGILVTPTVDGNIMIGPNAQDIEDPDDTATSQQGLAEVIAGALKAVPGLDLRKVITSFAGLRARPLSGDFVIGPSKVNPHFINVAGIESPGLTSAPAIGEYVSNVLGRQGLERISKRNFIRDRDKVFRFRELKGKELDALVDKDLSYSRLVCRCEKVTEAEIVDCIRRPAGALDLDSVKRRTRAGMGRCQGGFCTPRIVEILSRELGIPYEEVTKKGAGSWLLAGKIK